VIAGLRAHTTLPEADVAQLGPNRAAWFHDQDRNLVAIIEFGEG